MFKKLKKFFLRLIPSYRIGNAIRRENEAAQLQLKQRLDQLDNKMEYLFWLSQKCPDETMAETKKRVFRSMPPADGESRLVQQMNHRIMKRMKQVCDEQGIRFYLTFGTLLGAVRNQGFIPWDDDLDVAMLRSECERLAEALKNDPEIYMENCYSVMIQKFVKVKFRDSDRFFVDIFVMDEFEADGSSLEARYRGILEANRSYVAEMKRWFRESGARITDYAIPKPDEALDARMEETYAALVKKLGYYGKGNYVCFSIDGSCYISYTWYVYPKNELLEPVKVMFDGAEYDIFANYDQWLRNAYGDYWNLPHNIVFKHSEFKDLSEEDFRTMAAHGVLTAEEAEYWIANGNKFQSEAFEF